MMQIHVDVSELRKDRKQPSGGRHPEEGVPKAYA